jgi:hypothetical protein
MVSLVGQLVLSLENGYKVWEDPSFIKWRKRDPHVTLHCHDSVEGYYFQFQCLYLYQMLFLSVLASFFFFFLGFPFLFIYLFLNSSYILKS